MPNRDLGNLLQDSRLPAEVEELPALLARVDAGGDPFARQLGPYRTNLPVLGETLAFEASLDFVARFAAGQEELPDPFGSTAKVQPPRDRALARLEIGGRLAGGGKGAGKTGTFDFSASVAGTGAFAYAYQRVVDPGTTRIEAIARMVPESRLPARVDLRALEPGESHELSLLLDIDVAATVSGGWQVDLATTLELFEGLSADLHARARASFEAAVGLSIFESMRMTVGRSSAADLGQDWVRVRVRRESERRLTLGATVAVLVEYDARSLGTVLQRALDESPLERVVEALRKVTELPRTGEQLESLAVEELSRKLGDRAAATLLGFLDENDNVDRLVGFANRVVDEWEGLDERLTSWWEQLLGAVELGDDSDLRQELERLAGIDPESFTLDQVVDGTELSKLVSLLELFGGASWEDLVLASENRLQSVVQEAVGLAQRAKDLLNGLPNDIAEKLRGYAERTRIGTLIGYLARIDSKEGVEQLAETWAREHVRQLVQRLLGKLSWDQVADDLAPVQAWAQSLLDRWDELEERLARVTKRLKGEVGFSLGLEIERVTRQLAIVDLEVDPQDGRLRALVEQILEDGEVKALLKSLESLSRDFERRDAEPSFVLRETLLSARKVRTSAVSLFFTWAGFKQTVSRRVEELTVHVRTEDGQLRRQADYGGGFFVSFTDRSRSYTGSTWLELHGKDEPASPLADYPGALVPSILLTLSRQEVPFDTDESTAVEGLMRQLGFTPAGGGGAGPFLPAVPAGAPTRLAIALRVNREGAEAFLADRGVADWDRDYLRAAYRWFSDDFLDIPYGRTEPKLGEALAAIVRLRHFQQNWVKGPQKLTSILYRTDLYSRERVPATNTLIGQPCLYPPVAGRGSESKPALRWYPPFNPLYYLTVKRRQEAGRWESLREALPVESNREAIDVIRTAAQAFRGTFPGMTTTQDSYWTSPSFLFWLVLARVAAADPAHLQRIQGHTSLRWKPTGSQEWSAPHVYRLRNGVPGSAVRAMSEAIP